MVHTYKVRGMTCGNCEKKVASLLKTIPGVSDIKIDRPQEEVTITMDKHIATSDLQNALKATDYTLTEASTMDYVPVTDSSNEVYSYKPIYLIFGYLTAATLIIQFTGNGFNLHDWFRQYMAGFFLIFSFFKMLDLNAFAMSYSTYDVIAKRLFAYGYVYPFIELALGIGFLFPQIHTIANISALIVMSVSIIGVIQSMLQKRAIQCACLGAVFKLPLSKITLFEDGLMILMSLISLITLNNIS